MDLNQRCLRRTQWTSMCIVPDASCFFAWDSLPGLHKQSKCISHDITSPSKGFPAQYRCRIYLAVLLHTKGKDFNSACSTFARALGPNVPSSGGRVPGVWDNFPDEPEGRPGDVDFGVTSKSHALFNPVKKGNTWCMGGGAGRVHVRVKYSISTIDSIQGRHVHIILEGAWHTWAWRGVGGWKIFQTPERDFFLRSRAKIKMYVFLHR